MQPGGERFCSGAWLQTTPTPPRDNPNSAGGSGVGFGPFPPATQHGACHSVLSCAHRTLVITKTVKRLLIICVVLFDWYCDIIEMLWNHHSVKAGISLFVNASMPIQRGLWG